MKTASLTTVLLISITFTVSCGEKSEQKLQPGQYERTLLHAGQKRSYILYLPEASKAKKPLPLVLLLHGGGGNARQALRSYGLDKKAESAGFILVAPNGSGRFKDFLLTWNVGFGFGYAQEKQVDDVGFIKELIASLRRELAIDSRRIYATGISNGGMLCHWLAAEMGETFAAIAPVVATVGGKRPGEEKLYTPPVPKHPVSVIAFNGNKDDHVPSRGGMQRASVGESRHLLSVRDTLQFWIKANGCKAKAVVAEEPEKQYTQLLYGGGKNGTEVTLVAIRNQGHAWPGAKHIRRSSDKPTELISANDMMWEFFTKHPKPLKLKKKPSSTPGNVKKDTRN